MHFAFSKSKTQYKERNEPPPANYFLKNPGGRSVTTSNMKEKRQTARIAHRTPPFLLSHLKISPKRINITKIRNW